MAAWRWACSPRAVATAEAGRDRASAPGQLPVLAGGNNVPERYSSDLWVHGAWAYTGTWGAAPRNGARGDVLKIWSLDAAALPAWSTRSRFRRSAP